MHFGACLSPVKRQSCASAPPRSERVFHLPGPAVVAVWRRSAERVLWRIERRTVEVEVETYCEG